MMEPERRYAPVELRADGRGLAGVVMPYGQVADLPFGREVFEPGSFASSLAGADVILRVQHDRGRPLARTGAGLVLTDGPDALRMDAELLGTRDAEDALRNVRARILRGLSVEFHAIRERMAGDVRTIERAELVGIGLVDRPAYLDAVVAARAAEARVRAQGGQGATLPRIWL